jgi:hypothetical protein
MVKQIVNREKYVLISDISTFQKRPMTENTCRVGSAGNSEVRLCNDNFIRRINEQRMTVNSCYID